MPSHGANSGSGHASRRRSARRSSDAGNVRRSTDAGKLYSTDESARILEASREALKQAQKRHSRRNSSGGYYTIPRAQQPVIPSYEECLAEARARVNRNPTNTQAYPTYHQPQYVDAYRPTPYIYGYPSGYYQELRPSNLNQTDSLRTTKTGRSSTLVGSGSETTYSPTLVDSGRTSLEVQRERSYSVRTVHPRRPTQHRVSWGPTYNCVEPPHVSADPSNSPLSRPLPAPITPTPYMHPNIGIQHLENPFTAQATTPAPARVLSTVESISRTTYISTSALGSDAGDEDADAEAQAHSETSSPLLIPTPPPVNLSPSRFIQHETYITSSHAIRERNASLELDRSARFDRLVRNALHGSASASNDESGTSTLAQAHELQIPLISRWSPDEPHRRFRGLFRSSSVGRKR